MAINASSRLFGGVRADGSGAGERPLVAVPPSSSRAPSADAVACLLLPARPDQVGLVRHVLGAVAEIMQVPPRVLEDMRLAVTEACTNVVRHAYDRPDGPLEVAICARQGTIEVVVADQGRGIGPSHDAAGPGLGLPMIAALTDALSVDHAPGAGSRLTMEFSLRPVLRAEAL